jgi:hypothetical protein
VAQVVQEIATLFVKISNRAADPSGGVEHDPMLARAHHEA